MANDVVQFTDREAALLRETLGVVVRDPKGAAETFYADLFRRAPGTQALFVNDMERQGEKLTATLHAVILRIHDWPAIALQVEELGLRHVAYGVLPEHYQPVRAALLTMLGRALGDACSPEHQAVWGKAYDAIADAMIGAIDKRKSAPGPAEEAD